MKRIIIILALVAILLLQAVPMAAQGTQLYFVYDGDTAFMGKQLVMSVNVSDVVNMDSASFTITYSGQALTLVDVSNGYIDGTDMQVTYNTELDKIMVLSNTGGVSGVSGTGELCTITFNVNDVPELNGTGITFMPSSVVLSDTSAVTIACTASPLSLTLLDYILGDANEDGVLNSLDITMTERQVVGLNPPTLGADANEDGFINALDVTKVERLVAGLD